LPPGTIVTKSEKLPRWGEARFILAFGTSCIGKPDRDCQPSLAPGGHGNTLVGKYISIGGWMRTHIRNWNDVRRYYRAIECPEGDISCKSDSQYPIAWGVVFGGFEAGWNFMLHRTQAPSTPWFTFGSGFSVVSDGEGLGRPTRSQIVYGHAALLGVGYDITEKVGVGVRATIANNSTVFVTNGPSIYNVMFSVEWREWSDWNKPREKKKKKKD
jgi:hypothetical protein